MLCEKRCAQTGKIFCSQSLQVQSIASGEWLFASWKSSRRKVPSVWPWKLSQTRSKHRKCQTQRAQALPADLQSHLPKWEVSSHGKTLDLRDACDAEYCSGFLSGSGKVYMNQSRCKVEITAREEFEAGILSLRGPTFNKSISKFLLKFAKFAKLTSFPTLHLPNSPRCIMDQSKKHTLH